MVVYSKSLDNSLQEVPISPTIKSDIVLNFWDFDIAASKRSCAITALEHYFKYYTAQSDLALHDRGRYISVRTHQEVIRISDLLKQGIERQELRDRLMLQNLNHDEGNLDASIILAVRLLLMLEVGRFQNCFSGQKELRWEHGSLQSFVANHFNAPQALTREHVKLEKVFIARNLSRIAGINIVWTDNLADHLRMLEHDTQVAIFHHAFFLDAVQASPMFPAGLIEETLRTLALLFPQSDKDTKRWFKRNVSSAKVDFNAIRCGQLRAEDRHIDQFKFWRDRLVVLKQVFDEAEPATWSQWWYDRRKGVQRHPFLLTAAALAFTLLFGLITCVEGGLQVYKAYYPS